LVPAKAVKKKNFEFLEVWGGGGAGDLQVKRLSAFQDIYYYCTEFFFNLSENPEVSGRDNRCGLDQEFLSYSIIIPTTAHIQNL